MTRLSFVDVQLVRLERGASAWDPVGGPDGGAAVDAACGRTGQHGLHMVGRCAPIVADVHAVGPLPGRAADALLADVIEQRHFEVAAPGRRLGQRPA